VATLNDSLNGVIRKKNDFPFDLLWPWPWFKVAENLNNWSLDYVQPLLKIS